MGGISEQLFIGHFYSGHVLKLQALGPLWPRIWSAVGEKVPHLGATDSANTKSTMAHAMAPSPLRCEARASHLPYPTKPGNQNV
jgi:hypothetical protein